MKNKFILSSGILALALFSSTHWASAQSAVPSSLSYQGRVNDANGNLVGSPAPVNRTVIFRVWDSPTANAPVNLLYSEQQVVTIASGEFNVLVGQGLTVPGEEAKKVAFDSVFNAAERFLGVTVDDGTAAADPEITPRQQLVTSAFAFRAKTAEGVPNNAITSSMLAAGAVTPNSIAPNAIDNTKLAAGAVTTASIAAGAIDNTKLAAGAVNTASIAPNAIDSSKLAAGAVTTASIAAGAIDNTKLAAGAVTNASIADNSISGSKLAAGSVTSDKLVLGAGSGFWTEAGGNVYRASGRVGIGTSSPAGPLHIATADSTDPNRGEYLRMTGASASANFIADQGIVLELGQNNPTVGAGRHLWISDSARLRGANFTRIRLGLMAETTTGNNFIDVCNDAGTAGYPLSLNPTGGNVGIGIPNPTERLQVNGNGRFTGTLFAVANQTFSDARIKNIVARSNPRSDLEVIRKLQVTDYRMIDQTTHGDRIQKGFIAQEVQEIVPEAVTELKHSFIPSINAPAMQTTYHSDTKTLRIVLEKAHGLKPGDLVELKDDKRSWEVKVSETINDVSFVAGPLEEPISNVFVYGRKVDDFLTVNYDRLFTTGIGAIQELSGQVKSLQTENDDLRAKLAASERRFSELESAHKARIARLDAIESALRSSGGALVSIRAEKKDEVK
jgi:Chaperone of endosialidase